MTQTPAAPVEMDQLSAAAASARAYGEGLGEVFYERRAEIRGLLLALIARQHVLLLGPPGTAKSDITVAFAAGLGWSTFVRLVGKTSVPEDLFGPLSLQKLKQDIYERQIDGYLPTAKVVFLDEIFKGSLAILNTLLTALNERKYDHGRTRIGIPLQIAVAASNELPQEDGLGALLDRFPMRFWVSYLVDDDNFAKLMVAERGEMPTLEATAVECLTEAARRVVIDPVIPAVLAIRTKLLEERMVISDRRWKQAMGFARASAVLDGRMVATSRDLSVLPDCLWDRPEQRDLLRGVVAKLRNPDLSKGEELLAALREIISKVPQAPTQEQLPAVSTALNEATKLGKEAMELGEKSTDPEVKEVILTLRREGQAFRKRALAQTSGISV
jgi:MoxR-like ATPase